MAPLASIPEANTSLRSTFDTRRPRSRVVFLSRRSSRPRCSARKFLSKRRPREDDHSGHNPRGTERKLSTWIKFSSDALSDVPEHLRKSESPFDLDSFPHPPSSSDNHSHPDNHRPGIVSRPHNKDAAPKPPLALSQRKLLVPGSKEPANIRRSLTDAAADLINPVKRQSVDSALVAAVSRSIAQQLRLFSTSVQQSSRTSQQRSFLNSSGSYASTQNHSVNRFTKDLEAYAEQAEARGKTVKDIPTPPTDAATLHTVAELLPFRSQLRAAGLAVTSKEQASCVPKYLRDLQPGLPPPRPLRRRGYGCDLPAQVDGFNGSGSYGSSGQTQSTNTEISFAEPKKMDEFRLALIDEAPDRKKKGRSGKKRPARRCLPCFPAEDDFTTDTDWAHFKAPATKPNNYGRENSTKQIPRNSPVRNQKSAPQAQEYINSGSHSPHQKPSPLVPDMFGNKDGRSDRDRPNFITTGRRHSLAMPKLHSEGIDCHIQHRLRPGQEGQLPRAVDSLANQSYRRQPVAETVKSRTQKDRPVVPESQARLPQRRQELDSRIELHVDGQRGTRPRRPRHPPSTRNKRVSALQYDPHHIGICCPKSRGVPPKPTARPNIPRRTSSIKGSHDFTEVDYDDREISDRDVLRGLHVAASAACNEEIDAFVRNRTGLRIRRFLVDLMALETLTAVRPGEDDEQHARRRRAEMRKLKQQVRRSREVAMTGGLI